MTTTTDTWNIGNRLIFRMASEGFVKVFPRWVTATACNQGVTLNPSFLPHWTLTVTTRRWIHHSQWHLNPPALYTFTRFICAMKWHVRAHSPNLRGNQLSNSIRSTYPDTAMCHSAVTQHNVVLNVVISVSGRNNTQHYLCFPASQSSRSWFHKSLLLIIIFSSHSGKIQLYIWLYCIVPAHIIHHLRRSRKTQVENAKIEIWKFSWNVNRKP